MIEVKYLPSEWLDESIPETASDPSAFLLVKDGKIWLRPIEDGDERVQECYWQEIGLGAVIAFSQTSDYGYWTITISGRDDDGTPEFHGAVAPPPEANCFAADGVEDICESIEDLVECVLAEEPDFEGEISVHAYSWDDGPSFYVNYVNATGDGVHFATWEAVDVKH